MDTFEALQQAGAKITLKVNPTVTNNSLQTTVENSPQRNDLMMAFFKLDPNSIDQDTNDKLSEIYQWASEKVGNDGEIGIVKMLRDIKYRLGVLNAGESDIDQIHTYLRLRNIAKIYDTQAKAMEQ